jgi:hypothetical protein
MPRTPNETVPRQFRLRTETLDDLDAIARWLSDEQGAPRSRADAIRYAARQIARKIPQKPSQDT